MKTPWHDKDGNLCFPYRAISDKVFIYRTPPPEKFKSKKSIIEIPGQFRKYYRDGTGILLSVGPGYYDKDDIWHPTSDQLKVGMRVAYDKSVPWGFYDTGLDGKQHFIVLCGYKDLYGEIK